MHYTRLDRIPSTFRFPQGAHTPPHTDLQVRNNIKESKGFKMSQSLRLSKAVSRFALRNTTASRSCPIIRPVLQTSQMLRRNLSTTLPRRAALASSLPTQPTIVLFSPTQADIEKEELDVDLLPPEQVKLEITDRAAEVSAIVSG